MLCRSHEVGCHSLCAALPHIEDSHKLASLLHTLWVWYACVRACVHACVLLVHLLARSSTRHAHTHTSRAFQRCITNDAAISASITSMSLAAQVPNSEFQKLLSGVHVDKLNDLERAAEQMSPDLSDLELPPSDTGSSTQSQHHSSSVGSSDLLDDGGSSGDERTSSRSSRRTSSDLEYEEAGDTLQSL